MANINWTPPDGWTAKTGARVQFLAPCDCSEADSLIINDTEYSFLNVAGVAVNAAGGAFATGSLIEIVLNCDATPPVAYLVSSAGGGQGGAYVQADEPDTDTLGTLWYDTDEEDVDSDALQEHINNTSNPHGVTAEQVGADASGSAAQALTDAKAYTDIHANNTSNPHGVTAAQVGADASGSAAQALTDAKAYTDTHANNTSNPHGVTAAQVGADASGSAAQALTDAKAYTDSEKAKYLPLAGGTMTGVLSHSADLKIQPVAGIVRFGTSSDINQMAVLAGIGSTWFLRPGLSNKSDLGTSSVLWKNLYLSGVLSDGTNSIAVANIANKNDIATTKYAAASSSSQSIFKISGFGDWGSGAWYQKGFSMLITSRAGETVWLTLSANDSSTAARAIRLMNTYSKILKIYYSVSESAIYVTANAWCNNVSAHIISNLYGDYVPTVATASALASDVVEISITEMGPAGSGSSVTTKLGSASIPINLLGSASRPTYNSSNIALQSDLSSYLPLSGGTLSGALTVSDKITQGSPSSDSTLTEMNRFKNDLFVEGSGAAPNVPQVAGFYLGKSTSDENRHMDIVSGATYSYIDFNKAGSNEDYDVRLLVNVENGDTVFRWGFGEHLTSKIFNVLGTIQQNGSPVALKSDIPNLSGYLPLTGGTLTGSLIAPVYKSDNTDSAIKLSDGNEVNFGSNSSQLFIGYQNRVGSSGSVDTYKFGTHSGADGATNGTIECGTIKAKSGIFSGALKVNDGGGYIAGRVYGSGDDEGLIIGRASNGYAGLILGTHNDVRSVFYLRADNAASWRYVNGGTYELLHPGKSGTIATTADLPSTETWTFTLEDGSTVTKAVCVG